jgi:hypothetical protein
MTRREDPIGSRHQLPDPTIEAIRAPARERAR